MDPAKILIVEDEIIFGMDLMEQLSQLGYAPEPETIRYAEDAFKAAQEKMPDFILMDIKLKGEMTGIEAALEITEKLHIPIIFLTAFSDKSIIEKAKKAGPYAFLKKPVKYEDLKNTLEISLYKARMEKKLKESELRFKTIANYTYDWETWISPEGIYLYCSPSCERLTGYSPDNFIENPDFFYTILKSDERERIKEEFHSHISSTDEQNPLEFEIVRKDGEVIWIEHLCQSVVSPEGKYLGRRGNNRDITQRKKLGFELKKKVKQLQEALDNIKTLSGLIPICSSCKKIRDDKGYWNILEAYIQKYSDATFSHGICPECAGRLYGDQEWYKNIKIR
ncbi:hypothetical protein MTBBW1_790021 [Desulfamplus magnetovallimortis]|uniref:histidine kinase n=1 Tax=Desulfamplus magnetovallimortis TaxID=1246637 RepID=A0A1W1HJJ6_9BACT|nr:response regulator [Desulfamplus magnetovallimortis]SLM32623.1 hypothetical protein MTBBW1_790021 [Desulfamplus magnetovallimortis]